MTVASAVASFEAALTELDGSPAAAHTRRQFHRLMLALERDGHVRLEPPTWQAPSNGGARRVTPPARVSPASTDGSRQTASGAKPAGRPRPVYNTAHVS